MEFIFEFLIELIFEIGYEASQSKKVPKWLRYILSIIIFLFFGGLFTLILVIGLSSLKKEPAISIIMIALDLFLIIGSVIKFKNTYKKAKTKKDDTKC